MLAFSAVAAAFKIRAYDVFWHLAAGRWILEHRTLPDPDPFRFTAQGAPWVDHEWLFQVGLAAVEGLGGLTGLWLLRIALVTGLAAILWMAAGRAGSPTVGTALALVVTLLGARSRFFLRPELPTLLALALLLTLLSAYRRDRRGWQVGALLLLTLLWGNAHPGALMAPVLTGAFLLGARLPGGSGTPRRGSAAPQWSLVTGLPIGMIAVLLLNPSGWRLFEVPFAISGALDDIGGVNPEWLPLWEAPQPFLFLGVIALALLVAHTYRRTGAIDPATALVTLALAVLSVTSVRHQAPFFVGAFFLAAECMAQLDASVRAPKIRPVRATLLLTTVCLLAMAWCVWPPSSGPLAPRTASFSFGSGLEPGRFPVDAVDALERLPELGPVYNNVAFGGYLLWRLFPPRQVFNDGRNELDPDFLRELSAARQDDRSWVALLDRYSIDSALVRYDRRRRPVLEAPATPGGQPRIAHLTSNSILFTRDRFALVHWDDVAMVFLRRKETRAELLRGIEYRHVDPEDPEATLRAAAAAPDVLRGALNDVERRLREQPDCRLAMQLKRGLTELSQRSAAASRAP